MSETEKSTAKKVNEIRLSVPWGHVAAKTYGSASNFPVLCTHGHLDNLGSLHRLISLLPPHYYYVSIDLPGHGWSSHFPSGQPLDFFNYVLTIQYVVEALNWSSFHYIGHSFGIQLGVFFSIIYPGRIKRLIGIDGFFPPIIPDDRLLSNVQQNLEQAQESTGDHKTFTRDEVMYRLRCKRKFCLNTPAAEATFERSVSEVDNGQYRYNRDPRLRRYVLPILNTDRTMEVLANLQVKSMVIFSLSTFKIFKPEVAEMLKGFFENNDNIEAVFVEGNHDVHNNHPERLVEHISKFLDSYSITNKL